MTITLPASAGRCRFGARVRTSPIRPGPHLPVMLPGMALDADAIVQRIRTAAAKRLLAAAITLQSAHRGDVSRGNPAPHKSPAPKGEFPRLRTGGGRAAVVVTPASVAEVLAKGSVSVGHRAGGQHLYWLAGKGWKGLVDTYKRERNRLLAIVEGNGTP